MSHGSEGRAGEREDEERRLKLRRTNLASRALRDETVVLDLCSSTYLATNSTGTVLWKLLERGATRSQLVAALLEAFEVDHQTATTDVDAFLRECGRCGLLEQASPARTSQDGGTATG